VEVWQTSNLRRLTLGEEKRKRKKKKKKIETKAAKRRKKKEETTGQKYNGLPYSIGRP